MDEKQLLARAYKYLARKIRTEHEIRSWMNLKGAPEDIQEKVIKRLHEVKLLNDFEYCCSFIRTRNLLKPKPKKIITLELLRKGVERQIIQKALQEIGVDEVSAAKVLYEKNKWRWSELETKTKKRKAQEFLARKGFDREVMKDILG